MTCGCYGKPVHRFLRPSLGEELAMLLFGLLARTVTLLLTALPPSPSNPTPHLRALHRTAGVHLLSSCVKPTRCSDGAPPPPLALTVTERRRWQRLEYSFNGHAETQQLVVTGGQPSDLEPRRQTIARKPGGNAQ